MPVQAKNIKMKNIILSTIDEYEFNMGGHLLPITVAKPKEFLGNFFQEL